MEFLKPIIERVKTWEKASSKTEKALVTIASLLPLLLFLKFYYFPTKRKIDNLKNYLFSLNLKIKDYENLMKKRNILVANLFRRKKFLQVVKSILPTKKEIPELLNSLAYTAKRNNLKILFFKPNREILRNYYKEIPISIRFTGSFEDIISFLNDIENISRLIVLDKIEFKKEKTQLVVYTLLSTFQYTGKPLNKRRNKKRIR